MRFKEGSKVEVWSIKDMPSGSWLCAEIVRSSGQAYTVRYVGQNDWAAMEMVFEKDIRPCPPQYDIAETWLLGDVVELFDNFSWKMAIISKVLCKEYVLIRLLGSLLEFRVSRYSIRTRQSWQDGKWILIGKGSGRCEDDKQDRNLLLKFKSQNNFQIEKTRSDELVKHNISPDMKNRIIQEADDISCKKLKRRLDDYRQVEAYKYNDTTQKHRAVEKEGKPQRVVVKNRSLSHDMSLHCKTIGEKFIHSCFDDQSWLSELDTERRLQTGYIKCSMELDSDNDSSFASSVGSNSRKFQHNADFAEDANDRHSYAGSFCQRGKEESNKRQELAAKIHMLELHAYRCTMEALYASGPLSWDKEAMVTNLRLSLNISNDEHLMEVRNLVSADNSIPSR